MNGFLIEEAEKLTDYVPMEWWINKLLNNFISQIAYAQNTYFHVAPVSS